MDLRIAVVGSGAIGIYYGGKLAAGGRDVHFLMRSDLSAVRMRGLQLLEQNEDIRVANINCYGSTAEIGACDLVIVAVKTTSNLDLLELIPPLLHQNTLLLTLQNGLGNEEFLAQHFGAERVLGGLCFICLHRVAPGVVQRFDYGHICIGGYQSGRPVPELVSEFRSCGIECSIVSDLALERWRKLVWNVPFNGLSILAGGIDTASILADQQLRSTVVALMEEVIGAANAAGVQLEKSACQEQMKRTETMGAYRPSTLVDFEAGRPLEIEAIWGEPMRRALAAGAQVPRLQMLYSTLLAFDRTWQQRRNAIP